jgi:hypothetical protein
MKNQDERTQAQIKRKHFLIALSQEQTLKILGVQKTGEKGKSQGASNPAPPQQNPFWKQISGTSPHPTGRSLKQKETIPSEPLQTPKMLPPNEQKIARTMKNLNARNQARKPLTLGDKSFVQTKLSQEQPYQVQPTLRPNAIFQRLRMPSPIERRL